MLTKVGGNLYASCLGQNSPMKIAGDMFTTLTTALNSIEKIVPVGDGSGGVYVAAIDGLWLLEGTSMTQVVSAGSTHCVNTFEVASFQPQLTAFLACDASTVAQIVFLHDGAATALNVTTESCNSVTLLSYQPDTDELFYVCRVEDATVGGIFRIPNAVKHFPSNSAAATAPAPAAAPAFTEQIVINFTVCLFPRTLILYGYDSVERDYYLLATCDSSIIRLHFHADRSIDLQQFHSNYGPESMALDERSQTLWVTGVSACLWKLPLQNLTAPPTVVIDARQCYSVDIDYERNRIIVFAEQPNEFITYDQHTGVVESLSQSVQCTHLETVTWSPTDSVIYASCTIADQNMLVAMTSSFRCLAGYEWKDGVCSACTSGYYRLPPKVNTTVSDTVQWICLPAPLGTFVSAPASSSFQECPNGTYADRQGQSSCTSCAIGTASNATARTTPCPPCPAGTAQNQLGQSDCLSCPPQFFSSVTGSPSCGYCSLQVTADRTACLSHVCDRNQEYLYGQGTCITCPLGSQSPEGLECRVCPPSFYTPAAGSDCVSCDYDTTGLSCANGIASVLADHWAFLESNTGGDCDVGDLCIFHTVPCLSDSCPGGALQLAPPASSSSSSPSTDTNSTLHFCDYPRVDSFNNTLCGATVDGYIPWGTKVARCDPSSSPNGGLLLGLIILSYLLVLFLLRGGSSSAGMVSVLMYFAQITALEVSDLSKWLTWIQWANFRPTATTQQCLANWTPYEQLVAELLTPFFLLLVLISIAGIHYICSRCWQEQHRLHDDENSIRAPYYSKCASCFQRLKRSLSKFSIYRYIEGSVSIMLFCYIQVSASCFQWLYCISIGAKSVLFSSPTVDCHSSQYHSYRVAVIFVITLFVIGFPLSIFLLLCRNRTRIKSQIRRVERKGNVHASDAFVSALSPSLDQSANSIQESSVALSASPSSSTSSSESDFLTDAFAACCGPLYLPYREASWFYQPFTLLRRAILVIISALLVNQPPQRLMLFGFMHLFSLVVHLKVQPFVDARSNSAESLSMYCLILLSFTLTGAERPYPLYIEVISFLCIVPPLLILFALTLHHQWHEIEVHLKRLFSRGSKSKTTASVAVSSSQHSEDAIPAPSRFRNQQREPSDHELNDASSSIRMSQLRVSLLDSDHDTANL